MNELARYKGGNCFKLLLYGLYLLFAIFIFMFPEYFFHHSGSLLDYLIAENMSYLWFLRRVALATTVVFIYAGVKLFIKVRRVRRLFALGTATKCRFVENIIKRDIQMVAASSLPIRTIERLVGTYKYTLSGKEHLLESLPYDDKAPKNLKCLLDPDDLGGAILPEAYARTDEQGEIKRLQDRPLAAITAVVIALAIAISIVTMIPSYSMWRLSQKAAHSLKSGIDIKDIKPGPAGIDRGGAAVSLRYNTEKGWRVCVGIEPATGLNRSRTYICTLRTHNKWG